MRTNVTLKLDSDLLREARILAAEQGSSISALLAEQPDTLIRERKSYNKARRRALARLKSGLDFLWSPPKSRDADPSAACGMSTVTYQSYCTREPSLWTKKGIAAFDNFLSEANNCFLRSNCGFPAA